MTLLQHVQAVGVDRHSLLSNIKSLKIAKPPALQKISDYDAPYLAHSSSIIPEEEEDESSSEPVEAITPTNDTYPHDFKHHDGFPEANGGALPSTLALKPLAINTTASSHSSSSGSKGASPPSSADSPTVASVYNAASPHSQSAHNSRSIRSLFRRSNSNTSNQIMNSQTPNAGPIDLPPRALVLPSRKPSFSLSANVSPRTSRSGTPPSPASPTSTLNSVSERHWGLSQTPFDKPARASTGLKLKEKSKVMFAGSQKPERPSVRQRSTSTSQLSKLEPTNYISMHAATGVGLKARRMSANLPDDFTVDTVELNSEFTSGSLLPGKRGKVIGKGATATVKLMIRKGGHSDAVYAVKEFRKRGQNENEDEYIKKVKSEYSIAKSLHHPNIVESVRLCTHGGRWNHVMEYCSQGEIFSLVQKKYFTLEDQLCLFKQLLRGVAYLHSHGIAHRDIKLENLLMTDNGHLKITDFGVSEVFCGEHPGVRAAGGECGKNMHECRRCTPGICGSLPYIAPEVFEKKGDYDPRPLDVWSCAIVLLTMIYGGNPWPAADRKDSHQFYSKFIAGWDGFLSTSPDGLVTEYSFPKCGQLFSNLPKPALKNLLLRMMHPDAEKRITMQDALRDRWLKTVDCCTIDDGERKSSAKMDVAGKDCSTWSGKMTVRKQHNHLPPVKSKIALPQHRFDMGDGWS